MKLSPKTRKKLIISFEKRWNAFILRLYKSRRQGGNGENIRKSKT